MKNYKRVIFCFLLFFFYSCKKKECKTCYTKAYKVNSCADFQLPYYVSVVLGIGNMIDSIRASGINCEVDTEYELRVCDFEIDLLKSRGVKCK